MAYSMRKRILLWLCFALIIILGIAGCVGYAVALHEADEIFSARLATSARVLESLLAKQVEHATITSPIVIELPASLLNKNTDAATLEGHPYETKLAFQIWNEQNQLLVRSGFSPTQRLGNGIPGFSEHFVAGYNWHVFSLRSGGLWVEVAEEVGVRSEMANDIAILLSSPMLVGAILLLLAVNFIVLQGFKPLAQLTAHLTQGDPTTHQTKTLVHMSNTPTELQPLVQALNSWIQRTQLALQRERRLTDMAAHELRTPLAALTLHAHNAANAKHPEDAAIALAMLQQGLQRTKHLIEQMLTYSRLANEQEENVGNINLVALLNELITEKKILLEDTDLSIESHAPENPVWIKARPTLLRVMLHNLLENACKYSSIVVKPQRIHIELNQTTKTLSISNQAQLLQPEHIALLLEPYFRPPNAKQQGNGLGLAIAKSVAENHKWDLTISQSSQGYFTVQLCWVAK